MSTWFEETVACPDCACSVTARLARGVHVARAPEVRAQVLERTFHRVQCPRCPRAFTPQRYLVYTDTERKHWITVVPETQRARWPEYERATERLFDRAMTGSPLTHTLRQGFSLRVVFGLEELREKLVIWDANLDDAVLECLKIHAVATRPALARASIVVDVIRERVVELVVDGSERLTLPASLVHQFHDDPVLSQRFPELFAGRFVSSYRLFGPRYRRVEPPDP